MGYISGYILYSNFLGSVSRRSVLGVPAIADCTAIMQTSFYIYKVLASYIVPMVGG